MRELSLNILDIAQNAVRANAACVTIAVTVDSKEDRLGIRITDDGSGMSEEFAKGAADPFSTTRTVRRVGLGLPLFKADAEAAGGTFALKSTLGVGTEIATTYRLGHIDRPPLGNLAETVTSLIAGAPHIRWRLETRADGKAFLFDTDEMKEQLSGVPIDSPEVLLFFQEYLREQLSNQNTGVENL